MLTVAHFCTLHSFLGPGCTTRMFKMWSQNSLNFQHPEASGSKHSQGPWLPHESQAGKMPESRLRWLPPLLIRTDYDYDWFSLKDRFLFNTWMKCKEETGILPPHCFADLGRSPKTSKVCMMGFSVVDYSTLDHHGVLSVAKPSFPSTFIKQGTIHAFAPLFNTGQHYSIQ